MKHRCIIDGETVDQTDLIRAWRCIKSVKIVVEILEQCESPIQKTCVLRELRSALDK